MSGPDVWDTYVCVRHVCMRYATWLMCAMAHAYVSHTSGWIVSHTYECLMSHVCMTPHMSHVVLLMQSYVWYDSFVYATWLSHMCDTTLSCLCHDSFTRGTGVSGVNMCCSVLQCVAVCCSRSVLQCVAVWHDSGTSLGCPWSPTLQHTMKPHIATHCNTLQHNATYCDTLQQIAKHCLTLQNITTHYLTLQHTASCCNILQHTATPFNTLQRTATHCNTPCNTLQHTATHCNTLQVWDGQEASHVRRQVCHSLKTVCCSVLQCVAVCCSVLQCVEGCCSVLQCVAVCSSSGMPLFENRPIYLEKELQKRPIHVRRDLQKIYMGLFSKSDVRRQVCHSLKIDPYIRKKSYTRDLCMWEKTYQRDL